MPQIDARPPKNQIQEEGHLGPLRDNQTPTEGGWVGAEPVPTMKVPRYSLWSDHSFNAVEFIERCLPFPMIFFW